MRWLLLLLFLPCVAIHRSDSAEFREDFAADPATRGWRTFGDAGLFQWNAARGELDVTWDSRRPNSYFHRPLGTVLARNDDFALGFDLWLEEILPGINPEKPSTFEIAVGLMQIGSATAPGFSRGTGRHSPNLVEFDYFPPADIIAATVSPAIVSSNSQFATSFTFPLELSTGHWHRIEMRYASSNQTLTTSLLREGAPLGPVQDVRLGAGFTDFRVDTVSISSYNDAGDGFGSVWARGRIDNLVLTLPAPPVSGVRATFVGDVWRVAFDGAAGWVFALERSADFRGWTTVAGPVAGGGQPIALDDPAPPGAAQFYRVRAHRP